MFSLKRVLPFIFLILATKAFSQSGSPTCSGAEPACSDNNGVKIFPNVTNQPNQGAFGCLQDSPNGAWFYIKVGQTGELKFNIIQNTNFDASGNPTGSPIDVDFIAWGPFNSPNSNCNSLAKTCNTGTCPDNITDPSYYINNNDGTNIIDCSYSGGTQETFTIPNAQANEYYVLLVTNWAPAGDPGTAGFIKLEQSNFGVANAGVSDCSIIAGELGNDKKVCNGTKVTLDATPTSGTGVSYKWFVNTGSGFSIINGQTNAKLEITNNLSGTYKVEITDASGAKGEDEVEVTFFNIPTATKPNDALHCDTDNDGFNSFTLQTTTNEILGAQSNSIFEVIYFLNEDDAKNNVTANALTLPYTNPTSFGQQTVYARVHNKEATEACFETTSFTLGVTQLPIPQTPTDYIICDDTTSAGGNTDGITESFILSSRDSQILGTLTGYTVSYHTTKVGAQTNSTTDVIDKNTNRSVTNTETIYVRVENNDNAACFDASKELKLIVAPMPTIINNVATIKQCISTGNVNTTINLSTAESNISTNPGGTFEYYEDQAGTTQINNSNAYPVVVNVIKSVWVKTISVHGCSDVLTELKIEIAPTPNQGYNKTFDPVCDDFLDANGNDTAGSNNDTDFITNFPKTYFDEATIGIAAPANTNIFFYENQTDRTNSVNNIDTANYRNDITKIDRTNTPSGIQFPIYYKIISTVNNDCQGLGQFYFQIAGTPIAKTPSNFTLCDDFDSGQFDDGINSGINLRDKITELFAGTSQTETNFDVTFYKSAADANAGTNFIPLAETSNYKNDAPAGFVTGQVSKQTIYVRVQNKTTGCFNDHTSFDIIINPLPTISNAIPDIEVCDTPAVGDPDPRNGLARGIDLSIRDIDVLSGRSDSDFKVSYHRTRAQATAGLVSTELNKASYDNNPNFTTVTNGIGEEILYISIENKTTGCRYGVSTLKIIVYPEPNLPAIIDNYSECDHDNNGLGNDTDEIIENIALINKKEQILANYPTSEHDNFKVTFHTSKALAESGADPIDENKYKNTTNNQTIYVRVKDTRTMCVNDDLTFQIIINPLPTFDEIDTPQIVCLNNLPLKVEVQNPLTDYTYSWKDQNNAEFSTDIFANITKGGNYTVTATMKDGTGCARTRKFTIKESNIATITEADVSIVDDSDNNSITINTTNLGIGDYEFALFDKVTNSFIVDYQNEPFFENLKGGIYSIYVRDKNGCDINNIPVELEVPVVEFPKFFTPNGDGKNDIWAIKGVNAFFFPGSTIYIFNRYGKVVGNISVNNNSWDGNYKGKPLPSDDYWFNIQLINKDGTPRKPRKGHFSLIRKQ